MSTLNALNAFQSKGIDKFKTVYTCASIDYMLIKPLTYGQGNNCLEAVAVLFVTDFVDELLPLKKSEIVDMIVQKTEKLRVSVYGYVDKLANYFKDAGIIDKRSDEYSHTVYFPLM